MRVERTVKKEVATLVFIWNIMKKIDDIMNCIPTRLFGWEIKEDDGRVVILRPKYKSKTGMLLFGSFLKDKNFKVKLDDLGTVVWKNADGKNTVQKIGEILAQEFGPEIEPIYERLTTFLVQLHRQKFIRLDCPA